ncbi:MAG: hypothetical protein L6V93_06185 [Clostridiales bacterium]|nr:MAG: hypothetical protein L6V93_06185 [Clostridiales bacterium]
MKSAKATNFSRFFRIDDDCEVFRQIQSGQYSFGRLKNAQKNGGFDAYVAASPLTPEIVRYFAQRADVFLRTATRAILYI